MASTSDLFRAVTLLPVLLICIDTTRGQQVLQEGTKTTVTSPTQETNPPSSSSELPGVSPSHGAAIIPVRTSPVAHMAIGQDIGERIGKMESSITGVESHMNQLLVTTTNHIYICTAVILVVTFVASAVTGSLVYKGYREISRQERWIADSVKRAERTALKLNGFTIHTQKTFRDVKALEKLLEAQLKEGQVRDAQHSKKLSEVDERQAKMDEALQQAKEVVKSHEPSSDIKSELIALLLEYEGWPNDFRVILSRAIRTWVGAPRTKATSEPGTIIGPADDSHARSG